MCSVKLYNKVQKFIGYKNKKIEFNSKYNKQETLSRVLCVDESEKPKYKFFEIVKFNNLDNKNNFAICLGFNPAKAGINFDETNKRLIGALKKCGKDYSGYILLNLYPQITAKKAKCQLDDEVNSFFINVLEKIINNFATYDLILFFGRTVVIDFKLKTLIENNIGKGKVYVTAHGNKFAHPASNTQLQIIQLSKNHIKQTSCICELD